MRRISLIIVLLIFIFCRIADTYGQDFEEGQKPSFGERLYFGGNFWLQFGNITFIDISPIVGYRVTDRFSSGIGFIYQYYKETIYYQYSTSSQLHKYVYRSNIYGGKVFSQYKLIKSINEFIPIDIGAVLAHAEHNVLNVDYYTVSSSGLYLTGENRKWINVFMVGGGISQPIGKRSSVNILVLWDLIEDDFSPYPNPTFRVGFNF